MASLCQLPSHSTEPNRPRASCFTHNHQPQYHKHFIVIIITIQHTYYYNHSSPSHWHFSFALSFHFIPLFRLPLLRCLAFFFFCNQPSAAITLIFDPTDFLILVLNITSQFVTLHTSIITDTLHPKKLVIHSINHSFIYRHYVVFFGLTKLDSFNSNCIALCSPTVFSIPTCFV